MFSELWSVDRRYSLRGETAGRPEYRMTSVSHPPLSRRVLRVHDSLLLRSSTGSSGPTEADQPEASQRAATAMSESAIATLAEVPDAEEGTGVQQPAVSAFQQPAGAETVSGPPLPLRARSTRAAGPAKAAAAAAQAPAPDEEGSRQPAEPPAEPSGSLEFGA